MRCAYTLTKICTEASLTCRQIVHEQANVVYLLSEMFYLKHIALFGNIFKKLVTSLPQVTKMSLRVYDPGSYSFCDCFLKKLENENRVKIYM